jgi:arginine utilization protein RocB
LRLVINLDAIADDGDGTAGRSIALGTVGKVLPTALIVGTPVHSGFPLRGINAAVLAAAIAARVEWAPELTDDTGPHAGTPVSLLSLKDGKSGYDVTTPATTFATWSALNQTRDPASVLPAMAQLTREAVDEMMRVLAERASASDQVEGLVLCRPQVAILCYGDLLSSLRETDPAIDDWQNAEAARIARSGASLPEMCEALTLRLWQRSGRAGPAVILGLGSVPYLATVLEDASIERAVDAMIRQAGADHGVTLSAISYFPGISDMSFFGQSQSGGLLDVSAHTPGWDVLVGLDRRDLAGVPTVNLGPWGRDYHTPYERIDVDYGFRVLPDLVADLVRRVFA